MSPLRGVSALAALLVAAPLAAQDSTALRDTARVATVLQPVPDQGRAVDAEIRVALFELGSDKTLGALSRLEWLRSSPGALAGIDAENLARRREDLGFLLAETYYRIGMIDRFRTIANELMSSSGGRYAPILRAQLMIEAYRRGDNARALELASGASAAGDGGLTPLVAGLAQYRMGSYDAARASFASARQAAGPYAPYAQYMDALAALHGDTAQASAAMTALQAMGGTAAADFADQVKLTAAALAYQSGQFDQAVTLAESIAPTSGFAADALLTKAWALYKARRHDLASQAFGDFATKYPQLPQRDEARLMVGQIMMETGKIDDAERYFQVAADSILADARAASSGAAQAMAEAARALVTARAAGLIYVSDPTAGKGLALNDAAGADDAVLQSAIGGAPPSPAAIAPTPDLVSMGDIETRLDAMGPPLTGTARRAVYTQPPGGTSLAAYAQRADALRAADVQLSLARYRLQESLDATSARLATLGQMQQYLSTSGTIIDRALAQTQTVQDSLARLASVLQATRDRVRALVLSNVQATRELARENAANIDSASNVLAASLRPEEREILQIEAQTAAHYATLADIIERGLEGIVSRHPVLAQNDSVRAHLERVRQLASATRSEMDLTANLVAGELGRAGGVESGRTRDLRAAVASAEAQRASAENQLLALVDAELRARADRVVAMMRRDAEAAEYGSASASFFKAIEADSTAAGRPSGDAGNTGGAGSASPTTGATERASGTSTSPR